MNRVHRRMHCNLFLATALMFAAPATAQGADPPPGPTGPQRQFTGVRQQQGPVRRDQDLNSRKAAGARPCERPGAEPPRPPDAKAFAGSPTQAGTVQRDRDWNQAGAPDPKDPCAPRRAD